MRHGHHSSRGRSQELLYDADIPTPTHAERARTLAESADSATLSTQASSRPGATREDRIEMPPTPYGSFVTFALDGGAPVFLISRLAEHTRNLAESHRASLLISETPAPVSQAGPHHKKSSLGGRGDPLSRARVTLIGSCSRLESPGPAQDAFLSKYPAASYYVDFGDFSFWRLEVEAVRYIGGYGRMSWVDATAWTDSAPDPIAPHATPIIQHMNNDHTAAMLACCGAFSRAGEVSEVRMTGVDRYGFEMSVGTTQGPRPIRLAFPETVTTPGEVRTALVAMTKQARAQLV